MGCRLKHNNTVSLPRCFPYPIHRSESNLRRRAIEETKKVFTGSGTLAWLQTLAVRVSVLYLTSEISKYSRKHSGFEFVLHSFIRLHSQTCLVCLYCLLLTLLRHFSGFTQIKSNIPTTRHTPKNFLMHFHRSVLRNSVYADS